MSDTSSVFSLTAIGQLVLLPGQFRHVLIPPAVAGELLRVPDACAREEIERAMRQGWLTVQELRDRSIVRELLSTLDIGEAEAIALEVEQRTGTILMDERDGRLQAQRLGLQVTGVLGVLLRGKAEGKIVSMREQIGLLRSRAHFFIAPSLQRQVIENAGE